MLKIILCCICLAPATKRTKTFSTVDIDDEDLWGDDLPTPKSVTKGLHEKKSTKISTFIEYTPDEPPSPDKILMDKIVELRGKQGGRELKRDSDISRNDRLVQGW